MKNRLSLCGLLVCDTPTHGAPTAACAVVAVLGKQHICRIDGTGFLFLVFVPRRA